MVILSFVVWQISEARQPALQPADFTWEVIPYRPTLSGQAAGSTIIELAELTVYLTKQIIQILNKCVKSAGESVDLLAEDRFHGKTGHFDCDAVIRCFL